MFGEKEETKKARIAHLPVLSAYVILGCLVPKSTPDGILGKYRYHKWDLEVPQNFSAMLVHFLKTLMFFGAPNQKGTLTLKWDNVRCVLSVLVHVFHNCAVQGIVSVKTLQFQLVIRSVKVQDKHSKKNCIAMFSSLENSGRYYCC